MTLNGKMALILHYFTKFGSFQVALHKSGDNLRLLYLVLNICSGTVQRPQYKYSTTARWKFLADS